MTATTDHDFQRWLTGIFDRPVSEPGWWFDNDTPPGTAPSDAVAWLTRLCEQADTVLTPYTNAQINQGFWYILGSGDDDAVAALTDERVPEPARVGCVDAFPMVFARLFARRCSPHLGRLDEPGADPLNSACYMWWDLMPIGPNPTAPGRANLDSACLEAMRAILELDADACRESALHGLGHWHLGYPARVTTIIDEFLARTPNVRPELRAYALNARRGCVL